MSFTTSSRRGRSQSASVIHCNQAAAWGPWSVLCSMSVCGASSRWAAEQVPKDLPATHGSCNSTYMLVVMLSPGLAQGGSITSCIVACGGGVLLDLTKCITCRELHEYCILQAER